MTVAGDCEGVWERVPFLHEHLVAYAPTGRVEVDTVNARERLDRRILFQVLLRLVLYVVIECKDDLLRVVYAGRPDRLEPALA